MGSREVSSVDSTKSGGSGSGDDSCFERCPPPNGVSMPWPEVLCELRLMFSVTSENRT